MDGGKSGVCGHPEQSGPGAAAVLPPVPQEKGSLVDAHGGRDQNAGTSEFEEAASSALETIRQAWARRTEKAPGRSHGTYVVLLEEDEDGVIIGSVPSLPGCLTFGATIAEAEKEIKDAILCHTGKEPSAIISMHVA
ncbi:MAG: type II toxin-antitoxin system HicB family antitoxin [Nitrosopumilus sp.]|nr:type II toxin-antitoxin system HicB family antitoxin [Nitrosopumilus sp.]MDA7958963.1 type II toxin-antitoxin system HicB family antitoxin [Nitrosopumilus sp.]MDA7960749.1 type II toxin-antitoxin system HicB family antitoxin [Nitrosopumilus sp.]